MVTVGTRVQNVMETVLKSRKNFQLGWLQVRCWQQLCVIITLFPLQVALDAWQLHCQIVGIVLIKYMTEIAHAHGRVMIRLKFYRLKDQEFNHHNGKKILEYPQDNKHQIAIEN